MPERPRSPQFAFACFGYAVFSLFVQVAAFEVNKVFAAILLLINILLPSLGFSLLGVQKELFHELAAWSELGISLLGFYATGAIFLNGFFGRTLLPLGKPFGWIRKGAAAAQPVARAATQNALAGSAR
jgi:succinate-acetate transporter protein